MSKRAQGALLIYSNYFRKRRMELSIVSLTVAPLYANRTVGRYLKDFADSPEASVFHFLPDPKFFSILRLCAL